MALSCRPVSEYAPVCRQRRRRRRRRRRQLSSSTKAPLVARVAFGCCRRPAGSWLAAERSLTDWKARRIVYRALTAASTMISFSLSFRVSNTTNSRLLCLLFPICYEKREAHTHTYKSQCGHSQTIRFALADLAAAAADERQRSLWEP